MQQTAGLALYLVPSKALATEVENRLGSDLAEIGERSIAVTGLYGGTDWGPTDAWLTNEVPTVLVCTYEKAEALVRFLGPMVLDRVRLIILDEAHSVQFDQNFSALRSGDCRALRLENLMARLFGMLTSSSYRVIALSAVTAGLEGSLARWLSGESSAMPAHSTYRSTRQLIGRLECHPKQFRIQYDLMDRSPLRFDDSSESPYIPDPFPSCPDAPSFVEEGPLVKLRPYLAWAAMQLAQRDANGRFHSVLISITNQVTAYAKSFLTLIENDWKDTNLPRFFVEPSDPEAIRLWNDCVAVMKDYFTESSPEYRLLRYGIVVHHGKMPALLARRLKTIVEKGIVNIVLATSTLSEGVNLPVEYVLIPDVHRDGQLMKVQEFLNLVGRAGRPGFGTEGRTLVLLPPAAKKREDYSRWRLNDGYAQLISLVRGDSSEVVGKPESPLAELLVLLKSEWKKVAKTDSADAFDAWLESATAAQDDNNQISPAMECLDSLDGLLVAIHEEATQIKGNGADLSPNDLEDILKKLWGKTFANVASLVESSLDKTFLKRGLAIPTLYADRGERRRIYKTSTADLKSVPGLSLRHKDPRELGMKQVERLSNWQTLRQS